MNGLVLLLIGIAVLLCGYIFYGRYLCKKWGVGETNEPTPAHTMEDGIDYVPAKAPVLMGHHFSSIAGAGPITGPISAAMFGWLPCMLWILVGGIFFGGVHDFGALFASVRHKGKSIGEIISANMSLRAKRLFIIFSYLTLILVVAAFASIVAGTFAAIGFYNMRKRWSRPLLTINNIPVINADIATGVSLCLLFVAAGGILHFDLGYVTLLIAHITFNIPYVIMSIMPKLYQMDKNLIDAAQDLGCTWMQAFYKVVIPEILPGIINGLLIAFTMSIDDFVISYFTAGSTVQTRSRTIYAMTRKRISPEINAVSTLLFVTVLLLLVIVNIRELQQENARKKALKRAQQ